MKKETKENKKLECSGIKSADTLVKGATQFLKSNQLKRSITWLL